MEQVMAQSSALRERDYRAIWRLVGECRELGDDPTLWRQHFLASLSPLVDADISNGGEMSIPDSGPPHDLGVTEWGWHAGFNRHGWVIALERFHRGDIDPVLFPPLFALLKRRGRVTVPRSEFTDDRRWHRSDIYQDAAKLIGVDQALCTFVPIQRACGEYSGWIMFRAKGKRDFGERERRIVERLHVEIAKLVGGTLARYADPSPMDLAPRARQVLGCLLEGDSDKQIAVRLALSPHTVNQYTKTIYGHFGVSGRAELLARWLRRHWSRPAWCASPYTDGHLL
jgi:DNA-binding CsgD family transcriptional regulator